jgi:hypothetical protein
MAVKTSKQRRAGTRKGQPAIEYLTTYGWALLIIAIAIAGIYLLTSSSQGTVQQMCSLQTGAACQDIVIGGTSSGSNAILLMTNSQSEPIVNPVLEINASGNGASTAACTPNVVLPGGSAICNVNVPGTYANGQLIISKIYFSGVLCPSGNAITCAGGQPVTITGTATTQYQAQIAIPAPVLSIEVANTVESPNTSDGLLTIVTFGGVPLGGASIVYSANSPEASFSPLQIVSDNNGNAPSSITSTGAGNVLVTATFGTYTATNVIDFTTPPSSAACYPLTLSASPSGSGTATTTVTNSIGCPLNSYTYTSGSQIPLTATASGSYTFATWTGTTSSGTASWTFTMPASSATETADFASSMAPFITIAVGSATAGEYQGDSVDGYANVMAGSTSLAPNTVVICGSSNIPGATLDPACSGSTDYLVATGGSDKGKAAYDIKELVGGMCTGYYSNGYCFLIPGTYTFEACDLTYYNTYGTPLCSTVDTITITAEPPPVLSWEYYPSGFSGSYSAWGCTSTTITPACTFAPNSGYDLALTSSYSSDYVEMWFCDGIDPGCGSGGTQSSTSGTWGESADSPYEVDMSNTGAAWWDTPGTYTIYGSDDAVNTQDYYYTVT